MSLTAQRICVLAGQISKGPGFLQQAGEFLNLVLEDLKLNRDLKINRVSHYITLPAATYGPIDLPEDYLRTYDLFYPLPTVGQTNQANNGIPVKLTPITMEQYDSEFKDPSTANYPYEFATDISPQADGDPALLYVYPQSSGIITLTHRYMLARPDIVSPQTSSEVPWFPFQDYLVMATATRLMMITGDARHDAFKQQCEIDLRPYLIMQGDEQQTVQGIKLDPRHFHSNRSLKATKVTAY